MAITLGKNASQPANAPTPSPSSTHVNLPVNPPADPAGELRNQLAVKAFDNYCDEATLKGLVQYGISVCGLDSKKAEIILVMEMEQKGIVNERGLLLELEGMLRQYTNSDKKLDEKEKSDAIQLVCKARPGYAKGLNFDTANSFITSFCRNNQVKVKVGLFKWDIP